MRLLLTSGGLKNKLLCKELLSLAGKQQNQLTAVFIPTAANTEDEDKTWMIDNLVELKNMGFSKLDILDPSKDIENYLTRLEAADILVFGGGKTEYLVKKLRKLGLDSTLHDWLDKKVIVGISAGSVMTGKVINPKLDPGLNWVDFLIVPHMNSPFVKRERGQIEQYASMTNKKVYWLDDDSAVKVDGNSVAVVGAGKFVEIQL